MSNLAFRWTPDVVETSAEILKNHSSYRDALRAISELMGTEVTADALRGAFIRAGFETPMRYLGKTLGAGSNVHYLPGVKPKEESWDVDLSELQASSSSSEGSSASPVADRSYIYKEPEDRYRERELTLSGETEIVLFVPDSHWPFADVKAWNLMLQVGRYLRDKFKYMRVVSLGDLCDMYSVSSHSKDPRRVSQLADEIASTNYALDDLDALKADSYAITLGNHEYRLERYLMDKAPALLDSVSLSDLFRFEERGWLEVPYRANLKLGKLYIIHDVGVAGAYAAHRAGAAFEHSVVTGHTHRASMHFFGSAIGDNHVSMTCGWLGSASAIDYLHRVRVMRDWMLAFGIGIVEPSGLIHLSVCPMLPSPGGYRVSVLGKILAT